MLLCINLQHKMSFSLILMSLLSPEDLEILKKLTQDAQYAVSIAKIGVWNMHLPQIKGQIECAAAVGSVPYKATDMPQYGAQQVIG